MLETLLPGAAHLQNVHPLVVHFPLGLLPAAALLYAIAWGAGREPWAWSALWLLALGSLSAVVAAATGLYAEPGVMVAHSVRSALLEPHEWCMLGTVGLAVGLTLWALWARPFPHRGRVAFLLLLGLLLAVMLRGADYGGRLVYDYNAGGNACAQPIDFTQ